MKNLNSLINLTKSLIVTSMFALTTNAVHGQVVSVNFNTDSSQNVSGNLTGTTGIVAEPTNYWNEVSFTSPTNTIVGTATNLFSSYGGHVVPGLTLSISGSNYQTGVSSFGNILDTYVDKTTSLSLTAVPYRSYDVYLYVDSDRDGRRGTITDVNTSEALSYSTEANVATALDYSNSTSADHPSVTAVEFTNQTAANLTFSFAENSSGSNSGIAAIQIVNTGGEVPEPSTYSMIALAIGGMMVFGWTRRNRHSA